MNGARVYPWIVLAAAVGVAAPRRSARRSQPPAEARTIELGWVERSTSPAFLYGSSAWSPEPAVGRSRPPSRSKPGRLPDRPPHYARGSKIGLVLLKTTSTDELNKLTADLRREPRSYRSTGSSLRSRPRSAPTRPGEERSPARPRSE